MDLKKSLLKIFTVNFFQLIANLIVGFIVPMILSIEDYANLKTYTLLISYIGFFHFGFVDGLFIKYGGKKYEEIDMSTLKGEHNFLFFMELIITGVFLIISFLNKNLVLFLFSITILPEIFKSFYKNIYQATGEFRKYSILMYTYILSYLSFNILFALILRLNNYIYYCLVNLISNFIAMFLFETKFLKYTSKIQATIRINILENIKIGFFILLGNVALIMLYGIDKWFVKLFLSVDEFAYYSFAVSMLNIVNVLMNAISITFYNYLFKNNSTKKIIKLRKYLIVLGSFASCSFFILKFIITNFIYKYILSLSIISIIFAIFPYMAIINSLYINLYKVNKREKKYFKVILLILIISIIYNVVALLIFHNTSSIAISTLLTMLTWLIYSTHDLSLNYNSLSMYIYLGLITIVFIVSANFFNWFVGLIVYAIFVTLLTCVFYKDVIYDIYIIFVNLIRRKKYE